MISPFNGGVVWILKEGEVLATLTLSAKLLALAIVRHLEVSLGRSFFLMGATRPTSIHIVEH